MHLFLYGESGAGKSYAIQSALKALHIEPKGFNTRKVHSVNKSWRLEFCFGAGSGTVAENDGTGLTIYPARFDAAGVAALSDVKAGDVVVMDELGRMESEAKLFRAEVLDTLRKPCRVIGVCKDEDIPFMREVRETPGVRIMPMTVNTRQEMFRIVRDFLRPRTLCEALGVGIGMTTVIGGGGKTSLCEALARELAAEDTAVITTTTHVAYPTTIPWVASEAELRAMLGSYNPVWIGSPVDERKLGAPAENMQRLLGCCDCLIVEGDGSKQMPLKAHAAHEPVIPEGSKVISVIGADAFGRPIREVVHRPALFAEALGVSEDEIVTGEMAARAASRADTVLINKTESAEQLKEAREFAMARPHKRTVIASLKSRYPVIEIWEGELCVW